jgi:hypothetical protein
LQAPSEVDAERLLRQAQHLGHKGARLVRYEFYKSGAKGAVRQVIARLCVPVLKALFAIASTRSPFSEKVFFVNSNPDAYLFQ